MEIGAILVVASLGGIGIVVLVSGFFRAVYSTRRGQEIRKEELDKEFHKLEDENRKLYDDCHEIPLSNPPQHRASFCGPKAVGKTPGCFNPHPPVDDAPRLGYATTGELLVELTARFQVHCEHGLEYRPCGMEAE